MTEKEIYIDSLAGRMRRSETWENSDMADLCELAGIWDKWINAKTTQDSYSVAIEAAKILKVRISK